MRANRTLQSLLPVRYFIVIPNILTRSWICPLSRPSARGPALRYHFSWPPHPDTPQHPASRPDRTAGYTCLPRRICWLETLLYYVTYCISHYTLPCYAYTAGSYNGIYPNPPVFFKDPSLLTQGHEIIQNLCDYYSSLEEGLRGAISGVTLMNEPAHLLPEDSAVMLRWLSVAVDMYRHQVVARYEDHPLLFVNLIGTSVSDQGVIGYQWGETLCALTACWRLFTICSSLLCLPVCLPRRHVILHGGHFLGE